jgi:hypothetical protein
VDRVGPEKGVLPIGDRRIEEQFANLGATQYDVTSSETCAYNCVAWAVGECDRWWDPDPLGAGYYSPDGIPHKGDLAAYVELFKSRGYTPCESREPEEGVGKIAIYGDPGRCEFKHVARQLENGKWTSKLGTWEDIEHMLEGLEGDRGRGYGCVLVVMRRRLEGPAR